MRRALSHIVIAALTLACLVLIAYTVSAADSGLLFVADAVQPEPYISAGNQAIVDGVITVDTVIARQDGWVAAQTLQSAGKLVLNQVVGTTRVHAGANDQVHIRLAEPFSPGDQLLLTLHVDAGTQGLFEFPSSADRPVEVGGKIVSSAFDVLTDGGAAAAVMPTTGVSGLPAGLLLVLALVLVTLGTAVVQRVRPRRPALLR